jgi:hypothetical protein
MRMNRGTIILLLVSLVVIIAVLVLTINQAAAPGESPSATDTAEATPQVLFAGVTEPNIVRLEVRDDLTGDRLVLTKTDAQAEWQLASSEAANGTVDQPQVSSVLTSLVSLQTTEAFEADELAQYGLDTPAYSIYAVADNGSISVMHVGDRNPAGTRYYVAVEQLAAGTSRADLDLMQADLQLADVPTSLTEEAVTSDATSEATPLVDLSANPTLAALEEQMANEEDQEVADQLAATYSAIVEATNEALEDVMRATPEATGEATDMAEATDVPNATMDASLELSDVETSLETVEPEVLDAIEPTATAQTIEEATVEMTAEAAREPLVQLTGPQTVYLVNTSVINTLTALINTPPLMVPEVTETIPALIPEELTEAPFEETTAVPDLEATTEATVEATAEA